MTIVASPPDVREVSDLPQRTQNSRGYAPLVSAEVAGQGAALNSVY